MFVYMSLFVDKECVGLSLLWFVVSLLLPLAVLSHVCAPSPHLTGDLDGHWWDHASWHSSAASPMSLVRHVEPPPSCLVTSIRISLLLFPSSSCIPESFVISRFLCFIYTFACCFSVFFLFLSHTFRGQSKGKKKNN